MITNAQVSTGIADLVDQHHNGIIDEAALAAGIQALLDDWNQQLSVGGLALRVTEMNAKYDSKWSAFLNLTVRGVKATLALLPPTGNVNGDLWWVLENTTGVIFVGYPFGQAFVWIDNTWVAQGSELTKGQTGVGTPTGGTTGQALVKASGTDYDFIWGTPTISMAAPVFTGKATVAGFASAVSTKTANYTVTTSDHTIKCDSTSGTITMTLPTAVGNAGLEFIFKKTVAGNTVILDGNGSQTIDGATTFTLTALNESIQIKSDGTNWIRVAGSALSYTGGLLTTALGIIAGAAATPGVYVSGDTNTGLWAPAADTFAVATGGVERMRWDSTGAKVSGALAIDADVIFLREAANVASQRNGTAAQGARVYNTFTNTTNGEWFETQWASNILSIRTAENGSGAVRAMRFGTGNIDYLEMTTLGHLFFVTDNTNDIGALAGNRPRRIFVGEYVRTGGVYFGYTAKSANFTTTAVEHTYNVDTTAGSVTATLITAVGNAGLQFTFKKLVAANNLVIDGNGTQTIDGTTTLTLTAIGDSVTIESDGANWIKVAQVNSMVSFAGGLLTTALGSIAGTVSAPGIYVSGDTNTGIWAPAADTLAVSTGGVERIRFDNSGAIITGSLATGGLKVGTTTKTAAYTATVDDHTILCDTTSAGFTLALYTAVGNAGRRITIKKMVAANTLTIDPNGSQTIEGAATITMTSQYDVITLESNGTMWLKVGGAAGAAGAPGDDGVDGTDGANVATVFLFKRATSAPALPGTTTFTFATGALSGTLNSWTQSIPAGSNPLYVTTAIASAVGLTDSIASGEWATPVVLAQDGVDGVDGVDGAPAPYVVSMFVTPIAGDESTVVVGNSAAYMHVPSSYNGKNLISVQAAVSTVSSSGDLTIQLRRARGGVDMLSTPITIASGQNSSTGGGAVQPVVNTANDDVVTGDVVYVDVDAAGTGAKGLSVTATYG